jgi:hypothetical protein
MTIRPVIAAVAIAFAGLVAAPAHAATVTDLSTHQLTHPCTRTSTGTCIRGGQFCPQASYGHSGWDAQGHRWVCKGDHTHPHWMHP